MKLRAASIGAIAFALLSVSCPVRAQSNDVAWIFAAIYCEARDAGMKSDAAIHYASTQIVYRYGSQYNSDYFAKTAVMRTMQSCPRYFLED